MGGIVYTVCVAEATMMGGPPNDSWSVIHCGGHCISGPDRSLFRQSLTLLFLPFIVFITLVAPFFGVAAVCLLSLSFVFVIFQLLVAAFSDPGIIPKQKKNNIQHQTEEEEYLSTPEPKIYQVKNIGALKCKFCKTCNIYRPPRASHCSTCNNCVERFDHHCVWIGNCVGKRNYHNFNYFVWGTTVLIIISMIICAVHVLWNILECPDDCSASENFAQSFINACSLFPPNNILPSLVLIIMGSIFIIPLGLLSYYNLRLVSAEVDTNEEIKYDMLDLESPYSKGCFMNWVTLMCPSNYPSYINKLAHYKLTYDTSFTDINQSNLT